MLKIFPILRVAIKWLVPLIVVAGAVYWFRFSPVAVEVVTPVRERIVAEVMGTGTLEARVATTISSKISGRIQNVGVDQGDRVSAGDLLVQLDDDELRQQVALAVANHKVAAAGVQRLHADKARVEAVFDQAQKSHDRTMALVASKAISADEADKATEALAVATAELARAEAAINEGDQNLIAAEKNLQYHQARLNDSRIHAPFDGLIVKRIREAGDVAVPGGSILLLISTDELWLQAWVDETEMARLKSDQSARTVFRSEPSQDLPGSVVRLGKEADRETREFIVDVRLERLPDQWAVGMRGEVYIATDRKEDALLIPAYTIVRRAQGPGVWINTDGTARWHAISVGLTNREFVEVVQGLDEGQQVIDPRSLPASSFEGRQVRVQ